MAIRGITRAMNKHGLRVPRLVITDNGSVETPFHLAPQTAEPTVTKVEGDIYWVDGDNGPSYYDGSAKQVIPGLARTNTWTGVNTFSGLTPNLRPVYNAVTVLTAADSGAMCFFGTAAGYTYTLPVPALGIWFDFEVLVTITSVAAKILTPASTFLLGNFIQSTDGTYTSASHAANGSTIRSWNGDGSTTGGLIGDWVRVVGLSATQYAVYGMGRATGSEATPFATS